MRSLVPQAGNLLAGSYVAWQNPLLLDPSRSDALRMTMLSYALKLLARYRLSFGFTDTY